MNENTTAALILIVFFLGLFGAMAFDQYGRHQEKIACYEASKINTNLKCDKLK